MTMAGGISLSSRQRDLLPLPLPYKGTNFALPNNLSRCSVRRIHARQSWQSWANSGVLAVNQLYSQDYTCKHAPSRAQTAALDQFCSKYKAMGSPPVGLTPAGALRELCHESLPYLGETAGPVPFDADLVSLPGVGCVPVDPVVSLPPEHSDLISGPEAPMLRLPSDAEHVLKESGLSKPHFDPAFRSGKVYGKFIQMLLERDLIDLQIGGTSYLGVFFVSKKDGKIRMILDTRIVNCFFKDPPKTRLPSASALTSFECSEGEDLYFSGGDVNNAFYRIAAPESAQNFFTLPPLRARHIGKVNLGGKFVCGETFIVPRLKVLPMGWSWSLWICQSMLVHTGSVRGDARTSAIADKQVTEPLGTKNSIHAKYVDNFLYISHDPETADRDNNSLTNTLCAQGLVVHEGFSACTSCTFAGIEFDGILHTARVSRKRAWRLALAIRSLLAAQEVSGKTLEHVIGHFTWAALARRETLCLIQHCYSFIKSNYLKKAPLWDSVRKELLWAHHLLPLLEARLDLPWNSLVTCSDSSPYGFGVVEKHIDVESVKSLGRQSERWRFKYEDATKARQHALDSALFDSGIHDPDGSWDDVLAADSGRGLAEVWSRQPYDPLGADSSPPGGVTVPADPGFAEIPLAVLHGERWNVVQSCPWKYKENILRTEGRAVEWAVRRKCRSSKNFNQRHVFLVDNLPLVLGLTKGRAASSHLIPVCRSVCALSLVSGSRFYFRWIPSELNPADEPSRNRKWTPYGSASKNVSYAPCATNAINTDEINEEEPDESCESKANEVNEEGVSDARSCHEGHCHESHENSSVKGYISKGDILGVGGNGQVYIRHRQDQVSNTHQNSVSSSVLDHDPGSHSLHEQEPEPQGASLWCPSVNNRSLPCSQVWNSVHSQPGLDPAEVGLRVTASARSYDRRLQSEVEGAGGLAHSGRSPPCQDRHGSSPPISPVRGCQLLQRARACRHVQDSCSSPGKDPSVQCSQRLGCSMSKSVGRLCKESSCRIQGPSSRGSGLCRGGHLSLAGRASGGLERVAQVSRRGSARGDRRSPGRPVHCSSNEVRLLERSLQSCGGLGSRQDRRVRRRSDHRPEAHSSSSSNLQSARGRPRPRPKSVERLSSSLHQGIQSSPGNSSCGTSQSRALLLASRCSQSRSSSQTPVSRGGQAKVQVAQRLLNEKVHQGCTGRVLPKAGASRRPQVRCNHQDSIGKCVLGAEDPTSRTMTSKTIHRKLSELMHVALSVSKRSDRYQVVIELFSGSGHLGKYANRKGWGCICFDISHGPHHDLLNPVVQSVIRSWIHAGLIAFVWLGTPCNSWSRARHDINGGGPRNNQHIWGLPNDQLSVADQERVRLGNATLRFSVSVVKLCLSYSIPCCLENPATSMLWNAPPLLALTRKGTLAISDYCQYGCPWRKRTKVCTWKLDPESLPCLKCRGRGGKCSRTGKPHVILTGVHPDKHVPWTKFAEPYPFSWVKAWWSCIDKSIFNLNMSKISHAMV